MRSGAIVLILVAMIMTSAWSISATPENKAPTATGGKGLSAEGKQVVDYLLKDWEKQFRSTSIPLAMSNLGMAPNDERRLEIVEFFRQNSHLANNLKWWGANNYILSNEEKLIAKYLINSYDSEQRLPEHKELAEAVGVSHRRLKGRLAFLEKAGLIEESNDGKLGYGLAEGYSRWGGPLRHNFHTVKVEGEKPFDVW